MSNRLTINIGPESVARLGAIRQRVDTQGLGFVTATNASIVARGLELLCRELGIADPVRVVTSDKANEGAT